MSTIQFAKWLIEDVGATLADVQLQQLNFAAAKQVHNKTAAATELLYTADDYSKRYVLRMQPFAYLVAAGVTAVQSVSAECPMRKMRLWRVSGDNRNVESVSVAFLSNANVCLSSKLFDLQYAQWRAGNIWAGSRRYASYIEFVVPDLSAMKLSADSQIRQFAETLQQDSTTTMQCVLAEYDSMHNSTEMLSTAQTSNVAYEFAYTLPTVDQYAAVIMQHSQLSIRCYFSQNSIIADYMTAAVIDTLKLLGDPESFEYRWTFDAMFMTNGTEAGYESATFVYDDWAISPYWRPRIDSEIDSAVVNCTLRVIDRHTTAEFRAEAACTLNSAQCIELSTGTAFSMTFDKLEVSVAESRSSIVPVQRQQNLRPVAVAQTVYAHPIRCTINQNSSAINDDVTIKAFKDFALYTIAFYDSNGNTMHMPSGSVSINNAGHIIAPLSVTATTATFRLQSSLLSADNSFIVDMLGNIICKLRLI